MDCSPRTENDNVEHTMQIGNVTGLTTVLAVYGALLGSFTFGWTLYRDMRDRARIKFSVAVRRVVLRVDGTWLSIDPSQDIEAARGTLSLVISVVNIGRRPLRWSGVGGLYKNPVNGKGGFVVNARFLPKMLEEQQAHDEIAELDAQFANGNIKRFYIWDAAGRHWDLSGREISALLADAKKYSRGSLQDR
jgi:hypothetical protein